MDIERIVHAVLQRLDAHAQADRRTDEQEASTVERPHADPTSSGTSREVTCRVLSLQQLREIPDNTRELIVRGRCVITPAAADEIRQRGWRVRRLDHGADVSKPSTHWLVITKRQFPLSGGGIRHVVSSNEMTDEIQRIQTHLRDGAGRVVWCSDQPFAALLGLVRVREARSVLLPRLDDWQRAWHEADPNVLVVDGQRWSEREVADLVRVLTATVTGGLLR